MQKTSSAWDSTPESGRPGARKKLGAARSERLEALHKRFIAEHWTPAAGERNRFVVEAIPFLHHAMCDEAVEALVMRYYDEHAALWKDPRSTHEKEMRAHLGNVEERFVQRELSPHERSKYLQLTTERMRAAFRICRHLAHHASVREACEGKGFFLSYGDLGRRLLMDGADAMAVMRGLMALGAVEMTRNGCKRQPGVRRRATEWRWCW